MRKVTPSLSDKGFVTDSESRLSLIIAHALVSDAEQSNIHPDTVFSFKSIIANYNERPDELALQLQQSLGAYLSRCFRTADVVVTTDATADSPARYNINLFATITDEDNKTFNLTTTLLKTADNQLRQVIGLDKV